MKPYTLAGLLVSPMAAMAAPAWIMHAYNESVPEIHGKAVQATNGAFWLNQQAAAVCPDYDPDCPAKNTTIISGPVYGSGSASGGQYWFMGILQEGGQAVSAPGLDSTTGGLTLKYTAVNAQSINVGVWDVARNSHPGLIFDNSTVSTLGAPTIRTAPYPADSPYTWMACPPRVYPEPTSLDGVDLTQPLTIQTIPTKSTNDYPYCVRLEITLELTTLAAPQYYYCDGCQNRCDNIYGASACQNAPACFPPYCGEYVGRN
jgi:hypothetical protein